MADFDSMTGNARDRGELSDTDIFALLRTVCEADVACKTAVSCANEANAKREGRKVTDADREALHNACENYWEAVEALARQTPRTLEGFRAMVKTLAAVQHPFHDWLPGTLTRLCDAD